MGHGRLDRLGRRRVGAGDGAGAGPRLQLLRHGLRGTARATASGCSARLLRGWRGDRVLVATKVPPKNGRFPARADYPLEEVFPPDYIREMTERSLENLGLDCVDLQQLHVWCDAWADDERWQRAVDDLKREGLIRAFGISVNRWEPANVLEALRTGLVDCVQVVYNIFDQNPEDELFPLCRELDVAVIARVPFDEGSLTGALTPGVDVAGGRLANDLLQAGEPRGDARPRRTADGGRPGRHDAARTGAALHPRAPRGHDHDPRHEAAAPRRGQPRGQRRPARCRPALVGLRAHRWDRTPAR